MMIIFCLIGFSGLYAQQHTCDLAIPMDRTGLISLRDHLGRLFSEFTIEPATTLMSIDISGLTPGLFFISFSDESTFIETQRVVVVD